MQEGVVDFLASDHAEGIIKHYSIGPIFQVEVTFVGVVRGIHNLFEFEYFATVYSLLIIIQSHVSQMFYLVYCELDIVPCEEEFPTNQRTWLLDQQSIRPYLSRTYMVIVLWVQASKLCWLIDLLDFVGEGVGFGGVEFGAF